MGNNKNNKPSFKKEVRLKPAHIKKLKKILQHKAFEGNFSAFVKYHIENEHDYDNNKPIKDNEIRAEGLRLLANNANNFNQIARFLNVNKNTLDNVNLFVLNNKMVSIEKDMMEIKKILKK